MPSFKLVHQNSKIMRDSEHAKRLPKQPEKGADCRATSAWSARGASTMADDTSGR